MLAKELFYASIKERYQLNHPSSSKKTYHVVLDIKDCEIQYRVGDCVAIYPKNSQEQVERIINSLKASGDEIVVDREGIASTFSHFLFYKANLSRVNKSLAQLCLAHESNACFNFFDIGHFLEYQQITFSPQEFISHLSPLTPRFYSIASSMTYVGKEVHLTIALTEFESHGIQYFGTCSYFLTQSAPLNEPIIPLYFQIGREFTLSKGIEDKDIIMIGPGAGIAPFIGFMQERVSARHSGRNWLFFGERQRAYDYYYSSFLESHVQKHQLKLDLAFSRDQPHKIYVQHRMMEQSKELISWLDKGAYLFVCGDASKMAKDVEKTLQYIIATEKKISEDQAKDYIKTIRREKRYLRDVY